MKQTKYITVDGSDGAGKTTLVENLLKHFKDLGLSVLFTKEFGSSHDEFCEKLRNFALSDKFNVDEKAGQILFASMVRQHQERVIKPNHGKYDIILSDRGPYSNYAYGPENTGDEEFINTLFNLAYKDAIKPDLSIFIQIDPELALKRRKQRQAESFENNGVDRIELKNNDFQRAVIKRFIQLSQKNSDLKIITNDETVSQIDILNISLDLLRKHHIIVE